MTRDEILLTAVNNIKERKMKETPELTSVQQLTALSNADLALWIEQEIPWAVQHMRHRLGSQKHLDEAERWTIAALKEAASRLKRKSGDAK